MHAYSRSFVPRPDDGAFFAERMTLRLSQHAAIHDPTSFYRPVTKVAHRGDSEVVVGRGNHDLVATPFNLFRTWYPIEVLHFPLRSRAQWMRKVELQGEAFTKHIERSGTGYHLKGYGALQSGRIEQQHEALVVDDGAVARGIEEGTLVVDTRLRDALRSLAAAAAPRRFAVPSERSELLSLPEPTAADDAAYAVEAGVLTEAYAVRAQRQLDGIEHRLLSLEER